MIAMEMADENMIHYRRRDIGKDKLPLRPLTWVKKEPFVIPTKQVSAVIPITSRLLARTP